MPLATFAAQAIGQFEPAAIDPCAVTQRYAAAATLDGARPTRVVTRV